MNIGDARILTFCKKSMVRSADKIFKDVSLTHPFFGISAVQAALIISILSFYISFLDFKLKWRAIMQDKSNFLGEGFKYVSENPKTFSMVFLGTAALLGTFGYFAYQRSGDSDLKSNWFSTEKKEKKQAIGGIDGKNIDAQQNGKNKVDIQEIGNVKGSEDVKLRQKM